MTRKHQPRAEVAPPENDLSGFACPNEDCQDFNRFAAGNLRVCERMGKDHRIRRLYCSSCGHRLSERQGSLLARSKLPEETVVRTTSALDTDAVYRRRPTSAKSIRGPWSCCRPSCRRTSIDSNWSG